ncbi:unnamed protein product [Linum tenue]|uniref:Transmembrane protein n=1 Tax=Linum tenue TaxID=586396 RepID=A0AAV0MKM2_9ROSI|nr:unnamed protein product [Linum tenue]
MNKGDPDSVGMLRSNSMLDLESGGGIFTDDDEFRGYGGNKRHAKKKLNRLRSGSLGNRLGLISSSRLGLSSIGSDGADENNDKEKSRLGMGLGKGSKRPPKPPRPPRGPALDAADMKYIREISELSKVKHARIERMRSLRSKRVDNRNSQSSSSSSLGANILAMVVTVVFFVIIVLQGSQTQLARSAYTPDNYFSSRPVQAHKDY